MPNSPAYDTLQTLLKLADLPHATPRDMRASMARIYNALDMEPKLVHNAIDYEAASLNGRVIEKLAQLRSTDPTMHDKAHAELKRDGDWVLKLQTKLEQHGLLKPDSRLGDLDVTDNVYGENTRRSLTKLYGQSVDFAVLHHHLNHPAGSPLAALTKPGAHHAPTQGATHAASPGITERSQAAHGPLEPEKQAQPVRSETPQAGVEPMIPASPMAASVSAPQPAAKPETTTLPYRAEQPLPALRDGQAALDARAKEIPAWQADRPIHKPSLYEQARGAIAHGVEQVKQTREQRQTDRMNRAVEEYGAPVAPRQGLLHHLDERHAAMLQRDQDQAAALKADPNANIERKGADKVLAAIQKRTEPVREIFEALDDPGHKKAKREQDTTELVNPELGKHHTQAGQVIHDLRQYFVKQDRHHESDHAAKEIEKPKEPEKADTAPKASQKPDGHPKGLLNKATDLMDKGANIGVDLQHGDFKGILNKLRGHGRDHESGKPTAPITINSEALFDAGEALRTARPSPLKIEKSPLGK